MRHTLFNVGWRYLLRHPWQTVLMITGIMLGVAVMVAIDLANSAASRAFDLSTDTIAGRATHQVAGGPAGLDEAIYARLRGAGGMEKGRAAVAAAAAGGFTADLADPLNRPALILPGLLCSARTTMGQPPGRARWTSEPCGRQGR